MEICMNLVGTGRCCKMQGMMMINLKTWKEDVLEEHSVEMILEIANNHYDCDDESTSHTGKMMDG